MLNNPTSKTRLIMVEGMPGSGKTTLARFIHKTLGIHNYDSKLFLEGNLQHPADYESVACIPTEEIDGLRTVYGDVFHLVEPFVTVCGNDSLIAYELAHQSAQNGIPSSLLEAIRRYEIYDGVSAEKYCEMTMKRWISFIESQREKQNMTVFECCFLQNPGCVLLARHNTGDKCFMDHVLEIAEGIQELNPILFYLKPIDVHETIERVKATRTQKWLDFVIWYHTQQNYGRARGLNGFEGYIEFLQHRRELELHIIEQLPFKTCMINNTDYDWGKQQQIVSAAMREYL